MARTSKRPQRDAEAEAAKLHQRLHDCPEHDSAVADAHNELSQPDHSKGRPAPDRDQEGNPRPSNAGNDGA
jgi:hypothetical protein